MITAGSGPTGPSPTGPGNPRPVSPPPPPPPPQPQPTTPPQPVKVHGKAGTYIHHGCRCKLCCAAERTRQQKYRQERLGTTPSRHGLGSYNNYGCRCEVCTAAKSAANAEYKQRRDERAATLADLPDRLRAEVEADLWGAR